MGMAPLIQVIYAEEENQSNLKKMATLLHRRYGQYNEVTLKTTRGSEYTEYVMNKLPGGSRGIFIPAYGIQMFTVGQNNVIELFGLHVQLKYENTSWILTDLKDPNMFFERKGELITIKEYLLGIQAARGVFLYHNMTTYVNPRDPSDTKIYLICNNKYKQGASQRYKDKATWLKNSFEELKDAFNEEVSVGEVSNFTLSTTHPNVPARNSVEDVNLSLMFERERKRLSNVTIEGKRIKLDRAGNAPNIFERRLTRIVKIQTEDLEDNVSFLSDTLEEEEEAIVILESDEDNDAVINTENQSEEIESVQNQDQHDQGKDAQQEGWVTYKHKRHKANTTVHNTTTVTHTTIRGGSIGNVTLGTMQGGQGDQP